MVFFLCQNLPSTRKSAGSLQGTEHLANVAGFLFPSIMFITDWWSGLNYLKKISLNHILLQQTWCIPCQIWLLSLISFSSPFHHLATIISEIQSESNFYCAMSQPQMFRNAFYIGWTSSARLGHPHQIKLWNWEDKQKNNSQNPTYPKKKKKKWFSESSSEWVSEWSRQREIEKRELRSSHEWLNDRHSWFSN